MSAYAAAVKRRTPCRVHSCNIEHALRAMQFRRRLALQEMGLLLLLSFFLMYFCAHESKKREMLPHECSKELQEARTPPLCRCTVEDSSKRNPHWRAGYSSRSYAKFLRRQYIQNCLCIMYMELSIWRECSAAAAGITRTRIAGSAQRISRATLLAHTAQGTGSSTLTMVGFLSLSRIKKTSESWAS